MSRASHLALAALFAGASIATPAVADNAERAGVICGFTTTNDETGVVQQNPNVQFGEMHFGPLAAADVTDSNGGVSSDAGLANVEIHCWIQVNNPANGPGEHAAATSSAHCHANGTGVVAPDACQINYVAAGTDNVYLCVYMRVTHGTTVEDVYRDGDDDPSNGTQCRLAISAGT